jgi:antigen flippase
MDPLVWIVVPLALEFSARPIAVLISGQTIYRNYFVVVDYAHAGAIGLIGLCGLLAGYLARTPRQFGVRIPAMPTDFDAAKLKRLTYWLLGTAIVAYVGSARTSGSSLTTLVSDGLPASASGTAFLGLTPYLLVPVCLLGLFIGLRTHHSLLVAGSACLATVMVYIFGSTGNRFSALFFGSLVLFLVLSRRWQPKGWVVVVGVLVILLFVSAASSLEPGAANPGLASSLASSATHPTKALEKIVLGPTLEEFDGLAVETQFVPSSLGFHPFTSLTSVLAQPIPRSLWSGKPRYPDGHIDAAAFGSSGVTAGVASVAFTIVGGFYYDSGLIGVFLGMALTGAVVRTLSEYLSVNRANELAQLTLAIILPIMIVLARGNFGDTLSRSVFLVGPIPVIAYLARKRAPKVLRSRRTDLRNSSFRARHGHRPLQDGPLAHTVNPYRAAIGTARPSSHTAPDSIVRRAPALVQGNAGEPAKGRRQPRVAAIARTLSTTVLLQGVGLVTGALVARLLGPTGRGLLAGITNISSGTAAIGDAGGPTAYAYQTASSPARVLQLVRNTYTIVAAQTAVIGLAGSAFMLIVLRNDGHWKYVGVAFLWCYLPINLAGRYFMGVYQGQNRFGPFNAVRLALTGVYVAGVGLLFVFSVHLLMPVLIATILSNLGALYFARRSLPAREPGKADGFDRRLARDTFRYGIRAHLGNLSPIDQLQVDIAMVVAFLGAHQAGLYTVGSSAAGVISAQGVAIGLVALPAVVEAESDEARVRLTGIFFRAALALALVTAGAVWALAGIAVPLVYGPRFHGAVVVVRILVSGVAASSVRQVLNDSMRGAGRPLAGSIAEAVNWVVILGALIVLIPLWGLSGAATAVLIAYGVSLVVIVTLTVRSGVPLRTLVVPTRSDIALVRRNVGRLRAGRS